MSPVGRSNVETYYGDNFNISYFDEGSKAIIDRIDLGYKKRKTDLFVLPERIGKKKVWEIYLWAFDEIEREISKEGGSGYIDVVIPYCVNKIYGAIFSRNSTVPTCIRNFFFAKKEYGSIQAIDEDDILDSSYSKYDNDYVRIPGKYIFSNGWTRPKNGIWDISGTLFSYQGPLKRLRTDCRVIESSAFLNSGVHEIKFLSDSICIKEKAIVTCPNLERVTFIQQIAEWEPPIFYDCKNLRDVYLPNNILKTGKIISKKCRKIRIHSNDELKK